MDKLFVTTQKKEQDKGIEKQSEQKPLNLARKQVFDNTKNLDFQEETFSVESEKQIETNEVVPQNSYLSSFENKTVADIRKEEQEKDLAEFEKRKEKLIDQLYSPDMTIEEFQQNTQEKPVQQTPEQNQTVIEKPNYDLLQENKHVVKISKQNKQKKKRKFSKKAAGIALACALAGSAIICITNGILIDQFSSSYTQIDETYHFNLQKYLRDLNNLNATKKSMEFLETYPDDLLNAGDLGEKSNWFDRFCNFLGGLFGG